MKEQPNAEPVFLNVYQEIYKTKRTSTGTILIPSFREVFYSKCTKEWRTVPYTILSIFCSRIKLHFPASKFTIGFYLQSATNRISIWGIGYDGNLVKFFRRKSYPIFETKVPKNFIEKLIGISKSMEHEFEGILSQIFLNYNAHWREYDTPRNYYKQFFAQCDTILSKFVGGRV